mgnify:FL=1
MPDFQTVYAQHAEQYDALVDHEDWEGAIERKLQEIRPLKDLDVVEFGAGTGRLTLLLAPHVRSLRIFDASQHMLDRAIAKLQRGGFSHWEAQVADNRAVPAADASADLAISGWSFGHMTDWYPDTWRDEVTLALRELLRVLRPDGTAVLLETLGTGRETPQPPTAALAEYYAMLEQQFGFSSDWIRTDYRFDSATEAAVTTSFFFGTAMPAMVQPSGHAIVPECTGVWWFTRSA